MFGWRKPEVKQNHDVVHVDAARGLVTEWLQQGQHGRIHSVACRPGNETLSWTLDLTVEGGGLTFPARALLSGHTEGKSPYSVTLLGQYVGNFDSITGALSELRTAMGEKPDWGTTLRVGEWKE